MKDSWEWKALSHNVMGFCLVISDVRMNCDFPKRHSRNNNVTFTTTVNISVYRS